MDERGSATDADLARAREQFPRIGNEPSQAHAAPGITGLETSGVVVVGRFMGEDQTVKFPPEKYPDVENGPDRHLLETAFSKLGHRIAEERKQVLVDLVASFEREGTNFCGSVKQFLQRKSRSLSEANDPDEQARAQLAGWLGERLNVMFGLRDKEVKTVFGASVLESQLPGEISLLETGRLLESKAFLTKLLLASEEDLGDGPVFQPEVRKRGYPKNLTDQSIVFDVDSGGYAANPEVIFPQSAAVRRILTTINEGLDRPDALIVPLVKTPVLDEKTGKVDPDKPAYSQPSQVPIGMVETKAYFPWEVGRLADLTEKNPNRDEIGGVDEEGHRLIIGLARQRNYVGELSTVGFNREGAVMVLRFPADAPAADLARIGRLATARGNQNLVIQTLPYTRVELDELIEATLARVNLEGILSRAAA